MNTKTRREHIIDCICDVVKDLVYYDRKEDESLPCDSIEDAIDAGEITVEEMVEEFRRNLTDAV